MILRRNVLGVLLALIAAGIQVVVAKPLSQFVISMKSKPGRLRLARQFELDALRKAVPGVPGVDYPINTEIPETRFNCHGKVFGGGICDI